MFKITNLTDKELGAIFTPIKTAEYIISRLSPIGKDKKVLDPCVGKGAFIEALLNLGVKKEQIIAYDIQSKYEKELQKYGIEFNILDTLLDFFPGDYNQFDYIVGNPPYLNKGSAYVKKNKKHLKQVYGHINAHETYSMFIVNCIWRLKEGGKLGFITSDSFLSLNTHTRLRKFILKTCLINEILLPPKNLFSSQSVSINPAIIILTKCSGPENYKKRKNNIIKLVSRLSLEEEYTNPKEINHIEQKMYDLLPFNIFFTETENGIIELFSNAPKLKRYLQGYIGMHTHDNLKYIAAIEGTELAEKFEKRNKRIKVNEKKYKLIKKEDLHSENWKPYLKTGGNEQYYRPILEALDWKEDSRKNYDIPKHVPFEEEGIVISGVSSRLSARYMPKGCYWDSNKAIGFVLKNANISIPYLLGLLNSSFYNYLAKGIINNTNSIQITGIHALPFILPDVETKIEVEMLVNRIINMKKENSSYNFIEEQKKIDYLIIQFYSKVFGVSDRFKKKITRSYSIYSE